MKAYSMLILFVMSLLFVLFAGAGPAFPLPDSRSEKPPGLFADPVERAPAKIRGTATVAEEDRFFAVLVGESMGRTERGKFRPGQVLDPDAMVLEGVFSNQSGSPIELIDRAGRSLVVDEGGAAVVVADLGFCKVRCKRGYFACCEEGWLSNSCGCLKDGSSDDRCDHGGSGARFCSVGTD